MDFRAKKRKGERREKEIEEGKFVIIYIFISIENKYFFQGMDRMDIGFCARIFRTRKKKEKEGKAFRGKQNFIVERSIFQGKWGRKKVFSIESRQLHRCSRHRY